MSPEHADAYDPPERELPSPEEYEPSARERRRERERRERALDDLGERAYAYDPAAGW